MLIPSPLSCDIVINLCI